MIISPPSWCSPTPCSPTRALYLHTLRMNGAQKTSTCTLPMACSHIHTKFMCGPSVCIKSGNAECHHSFHHHDMSQCLASHEWLSKQSVRPRTHDTIAPDYIGWQVSCTSTKTVRSCLDRTQTADHTRILTVGRNMAMYYCHPPPTPSPLHTLTTPTPSPRSC